MRVATIGSSHIAALKLAIREGLFRPDKLDVVFWGVPEQAFGTIGYINGCFQTSHRDFVLTVSEGQYDELPAQNFDAIIFHGVKLKVALYLRSLRKTTDDLRSYSHSCLQEGLQSLIEETPEFRLARSLRTDYNRRVLISPLALTSERSREFWGISIRNDELTLLNSHISEILSGIGVEYLAQPSDTVRDSKYTKHEFCANSVRLFGDLKLKHPENDNVHMNSLYGARILQEITTRLSVGA